MSLASTEKNVLYLLGGIGALLTGVIAVVSYINMRDHRKMVKENARLENELKGLELELKKYQLKKVNGNS
jgi:uncharacterized membrane-anchored protein YhcB (DUF1043 family)